jgi:ABC-2 type transport system ATP-binding protein
MFRSHSTASDYSQTYIQTWFFTLARRLKIHSAVAKNADVIFMDEPTSGLDPKATQEFTEIVKGLGQQGKSVLMATHDIFNAVNVGTRIGIMRGGQLVHTLDASNFSATQLQELYLTNNMSSIQAGK